VASASDPGVPFGVYVHVPFCAARCGYCDFNTYTPSELAGSGASPDGWLSAVRREFDVARSVVGPRPVDTVFVGGGTPSLLGAARLATVLDAVRSTFGLAPGAEVTTESNPESTSPAFFAGLAEAGFTRVSLGMQSAAPHVLRVLERRHTPGRAVAAAREARAAGLPHVNLDLIYATPGETDDDLRASLDAVLAAGVDHVSAYALIVEDGTALARRVARGELPAPDDDLAAARYELIDDVLSAAGLRWYEVSNWAATPAAQCRHNLGYWLDGDWWGLGPGAHSHLAGTRWWNVKHPARYATLLADGSSPDAGREERDPPQAPGGAGRRPPGRRPSTTAPASWGAAAARDVRARTPWCHRGATARPSTAWSPYAVSRARPPGGRSSCRRRPAGRRRRRPPAERAH